MRFSISGSLAGVQEVGLARLRKPRCCLHREGGKPASGILNSTFKQKSVPGQRQSVCKGPVAGDAGWDDTPKGGWNGLLQAERGGVGREGWWGSPVRGWLWVKVHVFTGRAPAGLTRVLGEGPMLGPACLRKSHLQGSRRSEEGLCPGGEAGRRGGPTGQDWPPGESVVRSGA